MRFQPIRHEQAAGAGSPPEQCRRCCWGAGLPPCREEAPELAPAEAPAPLSARVSQSLAASSLELSKILAEFGKTGFRALGTCMYPAVRPGDLLRIEPARIAEARIGDIAVFRAGGSFFGHRIIATGDDARGPYILTRPDRSGSGDDGPLYDRDLLGIVRRIERGGNMVTPEAVAYGPLQRAVFFVLLQMIEARQALFSRLMRWVMFAQHTALYRRCAERLLLRPDRDLDFIVLAPLGGPSGSSFFRKYAGDQISAFHPGDHGPSLWTITLQAGGRPAALLAFFRCPEACPYAGWWLSEARTRIRYRATAVEEQLYRKALEILARAQVRTLKIILPPGSPELRSWVSRGFKKISAEALHEPAGAPFAPAQRIILEAAIA